MGRYSLKALRLAVHSRYLMYRAIERLVHSDRFAEFYKNNENVAKELLEGRTRYVKIKMKEYYKDDLSYIKLRFLASSLQITNYSRMSKGQLERAIDKRRTEISNSSEKK